MNTKYIISERTAGANPFHIFDELKNQNAEELRWIIKRMPYSSFLRTAYWFAVSHKAKAHAGMRCQVCNSSESINVHHRTYESHGSEHLNMNDLVVLCESCHGLFHGHKTGNPEIEESKPRNGRQIVIPHSDSDMEIPSEENITLTKELIDKCRANGSFTSATMRAFGVVGKPEKGWTRRLIGKSITRDQYKAAAEGRFIYSS